MDKKLIYVVDDEENIRDLIKSYLLMEGFEVETFSDGSSAFLHFNKKEADMLIIDVMMPNMDGYSLCKEIRKLCDVPIIMVSAKDEEIDRILGLELGSDDYLSKPFSPRELVARVKTIFRRTSKTHEASSPAVNQSIPCYDIIICSDERSVTKDNKIIELTAKEYDFLLFLVTNKNKVFNREQLMNHIWGYAYVGESRSIDDLVKRVRRKLIEAGSTLEITTVWGYGYKITE